MCFQAYLKTSIVVQPSKLWMLVSGMYIPPEESSWGTLAIYLFRTPWKINMKPNHGGLVLIIFLSKWLICRFHVNLSGCMHFDFVCVLTGFHRPQQKKHC